jgi:4-hydroxyacetophenone monooxygenase
MASTRYRASGAWYWPLMSVHVDVDGLRQCRLRCQRVRIRWGLLVVSRGVSSSRFATGSSGPQALTPEQVRAAVAIANVPALLMVVFQMTGDEGWLEPPYQPTRGKGLGDHDGGGLPAAVQNEIRSAAEDAILRLQAGWRPAIAAPSAELTARMVTVCMGEPVGREHGALLSVELARRSGADLPELTEPASPPPPGYRILVIGAGVAGIAAAHQLQDMGVEYTIVDKQPGPGGNWWQNTYPGAGVDTPSHLYSFSFAQEDWSRHFELRDDLQSRISASKNTCDTGQRPPRRATTSSGRYGRSGSATRTVPRKR